MRVVGHMYHLGWGWGGGVVTMVLTLEELRRRGHSVALLLQKGSLRHKTFGDRSIGITDVYSNPLPVSKRRIYREADMIVTQGEATPEAMAMSSSMNKPLAHLIHDEGQLDHYSAKASQVQLAIYNAAWVQAAAEEKGRKDRAIVLNPLIFPEDYAVQGQGDAIMLVNLCEEKGGKLFWDLVKRMPKHKFIGVKGGWGGQIVPSKLPANAQVMEHQLDPRVIYKRARIILMPSQDLGTPGMRWWTESWGRVGIEAAASGIPTIAHPTPGLTESLGAAGIFCDRYEPEAWVRAIKHLDNPKNYEEASLLSLIRSEELRPEPQLEAVEAAMLEITGEWKARPYEHPMDLVRKARDGGQLVKVQALVSFMGDHGMVKAGQVMEMPAVKASPLMRRNLVMLAPGEVPADVIVPEETQQHEGPREIKESLGVTYRKDRGPRFSSREEMMKAGG